MPIKYLLNGKQINLTSDNTIINSTNFNVDKDGNMSCSNANILGGDIELSTDDLNNAKVIAKTTDGSIYTQIRPTGIRTMYDGKLLFWVNGTATTIANIHGQGVVFAGNALYIKDDTNSNDDYPISLTGTNGNIKCVSLTQTSLEETKKNFEKLENGLDIIKNTEIYKYNLKSQNDTDKKHIGFVIGENYKYSNEITAIDNEGKEVGVDTYSMISVAYKAIQEQQMQINQLQNEINKLKGERKDEQS